MHRRLRRPLVLASATLLCSLGVGSAQALGATAPNNLPETATLTEPGSETSQGIGEDCVTAAGRFAAVVYAPREAVNHEEQFRAGGLAVVVDLASVAVRKLPFTINLTYYNPGCGAGDQVIFTRNLAVGDTCKSRLVTVDAPTAKVVRTLSPLIGSRSSSSRAKRGSHRA